MPLLRRIVNLFSRAEVDREIDTELRAHLEMRIEDNVAAGMSPEEARRDALLRFGNPTVTKERVAAADAALALDGLWADIRHGIRQLRRSPGFTSVALITLALGIGANTAIFSLIDAALLKMLPVRDPQQLVELKTMSPTIGTEDSFSYPAFKAFRGRNKALQGALAFRKLYNMDFEVDGQGGLANGQLVSGNYFSLLGVKAALGRTIVQADESVAGQNPVAVIGYDYWRARFALDPAIVGKKILLNNASFTIIGVTETGFYGLQPGTRIDVSVPLTTINLVRPDFAAAGTPYDTLKAPFRTWLHVMGRLEPGVTRERASASLQPLFAEQMREAAESLHGPSFETAVRKEMLATTLRLDAGGQGLAALRLQFSRPLWVVMAVVGLLLLVTCANVANLQLARANTRQREIAVRLTLGAGRLRLVRQLITESALLALAGGALGLVFAFLGSSSLLGLLTHAQSPVVLTVRPDSAVLGFTLLVSLLTALFFGMIPAWRAARLDMTPALMQSARSRGEGQGRSRVGKALVVLQVSASLVLMIGAGLLGRSLENLRDFNPGFNKDNVLLFSLNPMMTGYTDTQLVPLYERMLDRLKAIPGVRSASFGIHSPLSSSFSSAIVSVQGYTPQPGQELTPVGIEVVGPDYFKTLETPVLRGRDFTAADRAGAPKVAIVNETMARYYFGDADPIGRQVSIPSYRGDASWLQIVALVKDARYHDLREQSTPAIYLPLYQAPESGITFELRTALDPSGIESTALAAVKATDSRLPVFDVKTLGSQLDDSLVEERLVASLSSMFGALALLLACVGLYGVMAYTVNRRTGEIGIRMALGAERAQIARMVLRESLVLVAIGVIIGALAAIGASRLIASQLYGVRPGDPDTFLAACAVMAVVTIVASYLPARRAASVNPIQALRSD
jgi:predicted permease